jgi:hypothetical protein
MEVKLSKIDPIQNNIPNDAVIQKVTSDREKLSNDKHDKAVKAFLIADAIASGIGNDLAFVDKIPQFIDEIIENKSWECLFVSKGVAYPYYCRYDKGTDSENFRAFITAKRPNGLGTSVETLDRVLQADLKVQWKFRDIFNGSNQGERNDLTTSGSDCPKLDLSERQQKYLRAANRAAEAIPVIRELLDRGLIAIDIAAKLGRQITDPENLTAEEREYIDKRDLVGLRINKYLNTNTIPEDEDREPAYSRELNRFVKDLLGIKDRSKAVRMDNPKKAAEKLLKFYEGQKLQELLNYLKDGLGSTTSTEQISSEKEAGIKDDIKSNQAQKNSIKENISATSSKNGSSSINKMIGEAEKIPASLTLKSKEKANGLNHSKSNNEKQKTIDNPENIFEKQLSRTQLAQRLRLNPKSISNFICSEPEKFSQWTQKKDPEGIAWERTKEKQGRSFFFVPAKKVNQSID